MKTESVRDAPSPRKPRRPWSAIPSAEDVARAARAWISPPPELPGIELDVEKQLDLLAELGRRQADVRLPAMRANGWRYYHMNGFYGFGNAIVLYGVIRHVSPARIVEIGSGFRSALTLDTNDRFFNGAIDCTFIDPFPENRLLKLLRPADLDRVTIIRHFLQDIDLSVFDSLRAGDILFIDSSHVSKMGSDVNLLFFDVIPRLPVGTWIHFHDISYPFEYPPESIKDRRAWSEAYLLRAFLEHNCAFRICFFFDYLKRFHREAVERALPGSIAPSTAHIWLERTA